VQSDDGALGSDPHDFYAVLFLGFSSTQGASDMATPIRIGIMGFGRIARNLFRILYGDDRFELAALADPTDAEALEYLLSFDTLLGPFPDELSVRDGHIYVDGMQIPVLAEASEEIDWSAHGVDVVIAASNTSRSRAELESHLDRGAGRIILCTPPLDTPDITVVTGINDDQVKREHRILSNASCTAHCIAPVLKILDDAFGIEHAFLSTVHAYTAQQRLADVPAEDPRRGRAAAENIIPQDTNAGVMVEELLPSLAGRVTAQAINVPVANGSVVDLVCWHRKKVSKTPINEVIRTAAAASWQGLLDYEEEPIVSSDIVSSPFSGTFDALSTVVMDEEISKTLTWYDNGWGYAHRVVDLITRLAELDAEGAAS